MTSEQIVAEIRRLAGNLDGTRDGRYDEFDLGTDVLDLLRKEFGCGFCEADIAPGRGYFYLGKQYHYSCLPPDLDVCVQCQDVEEKRKMLDGKCERCRCTRKEEDGDLGIRCA